MLCHITEFENLESILKNGLISLRKLNRLGLQVKHLTTPESRQIDCYYRLDDFVRLAYTPYYDMIPANTYYGYIQNPVIICIDSKILLNKTGILYSNKNALANDVYLCENEEEIYKYIDFDKTYTKRTMENYDDVEYKNARQAEILIPHCIERSYIKKIVVEEGMDISNLCKYGISIEHFTIKDSYHF